MRQLLITVSSKLKPTVLRIERLGGLLTKMKQKSQSQWNLLGGRHMVTHHDSDSLSGGGVGTGGGLVGGSGEGGLTDESCWV